MVLGASQTHTECAAVSGILSVNILAQFLQNRQAVLDFLVQLQPTAVLVMDDMGMAQQIKTLLPNCIVIHRTYHPDDAEFHMKWTPTQFADAYLANVPQGIVVQVLNEPSGYSNLPNLAGWCSSVMSIASGRGIRVCVPNFGVGHPTEAPGTQLDGLWTAFGLFPEHYLGVHEYFQQDPVGEQPYHIKRWQSAVTRCQQLGITPPKIIVTEAGRDVGGGHDGWKVVFSESVYASKLQQQATLYKNTSVVGMCVFCMGKGGGNRWETFDIETAGTVKQSMIDWNRNNPMTQPNYGTRIPDATVVLVGASAVNIRPAPSTNNTPVGQLLGGEVVAYYSNPVNGWWQFEWQGQLRYVSSTYVQFNTDNAQELWIQQMQVHNDAIADLLANPPS
jgi:hypothetical protein